MPATGTMYCSVHSMSPFDGVCQGLELTFWAICVLHVQRSKKQWCYALSMWLALHFKRATLSAPSPATCGLTQAFFIAVWPMHSPMSLHRCNIAFVYSVSVALFDGALDKIPCFWSDTFFCVLQLILGQCFYWLLILDALCVMLCSPWSIPKHSEYHSRSVECNDFVAKNNL